MLLLLLSLHGCFRAAVAVNPPLVLLLILLL
jgi:hypothetical protein